MEIVKVCIPEESSKYYDSNGIELHVGDWCVVEGEYSADIGEVLWKYETPSLPSLSPCTWRDEEGTTSMFKVLRRATETERQRAEDNRIKARQAFKICQKKIAGRNLPMKLSMSKYTLDGERIIFYFISEQRVDFRRLVSDLAKTFRKRIELIHIGVRDEAAMIGGCGHCGRPLCCKTFIQDFQSVAIRMAKNQDMNLAPEKISGICGRLLCCLQYENDWYIEAQKRMPKLRARVKTPRGLGVVKEVNLFKETVRVHLDRGEIVELEANNISPLKRQRRRSGSSF
ncbi:TPA: stage 0 sporulation protein [Candidatus Poribacteria bacterium]|nr:stage 0 sporulation protein [Candidatus Poribacteria bacterium]